MIAKAARERARLVSSRESTEDSAGSSVSEAERFDPLRDGPDLAYEHIHRYVLATRIVEGLRVLDLASGTGYGSALLSRSARSLVSLDLEAAHLGGVPAGVCGDALRLPFRDESFDVVVCFEAIEHVPEPARLVSEARRVLAGPRILLVSTPDREIYTARAGHRNPFHIAEMSRSEFQRALRKDFGHVRMLGQGLWAGSWIAGLAPGQAARGLGRRTVDALAFPENPVATDEASRGVGRGARWADPKEDELPVPVYLLAACADSKQGRLLLARQVPRESILHDGGQWLLGHYDRLTQAWDQELRTFQSQIASARRGHEDLSGQIESARAAISEFEQERLQARTTIGELEEQIAESRRVAVEHERELARARENARDQDRQLRVARSSTEALETELRRMRDDRDALSMELAATRDASASKAADLVSEVAQLQSDIALGETAREALNAELESKRGALESAAISTAELESQMTAARSASEDLETQLTGARSANADLETQLTGARSANADLETQLTGARSANADLETQLTGARSA
ncbi:MAG: hypothetical protein CL908_21745, partial [Deltaproteobacteria bacterium]|nr:hypothetical protein [Deltaproteobacteria bacterium]